MARYLVTLLIFGALFTSANASEEGAYHYSPVVVNGNHYYYSSDRDHGCTMGHYRVKIDDGEIRLRSRSSRYHDAVIRRDGRLFVEGEEVELTADQKALVTEFQDCAAGLEIEAKSIAKEGVKIGAAGAKLGIEVVGSLFKLLRYDYDTDDFEREIEMKADHIEAKADKLEARAEKIEQEAEKLEMLEERLESEIPSLERNTRD